MKAVLLLSATAGAGRSLLAANLAPLLAAADAPAALVETCEPGDSEVALYLGQEPGGLEAAPSPDGLLHVCARDAIQLRLALLSLKGRTTGWALVDGASLDQPGWQEMAAACGSVILVERADLAGCRRMQRLLRACASAHLPKASLLAAWMGEHPAQPLPPLDIQAIAIPWHPKAAERLAEGRVASLADSRSPFRQALDRLALQLQKLETLPASTAPGPGIIQSEDEPLFQRLQQDLRRRLDQDVIEGRLVEGQPATVEPRVRAAAEDLVASERSLAGGRRASLVRRLVQDAVGLGPLEDLLADATVSEVMVNHPGQVFVERAGRLHLHPLVFRDAAQLKAIIERIVAPLGRRIDESSPRVDARLPDGSRVNAIIPPLALKGPCLTIRKFPTHRPTLDELAERGSLSRPAADFLRLAVEQKLNILVSGGTGSGKTTLLNALSAYIPEGERVITIEDSAELKLQQPHVVTLESRPPNLEGKGEVSIRELLVNALRMRPDRIVVGECRGGEALDMLQAMNTGHEGSLSTLHANSSRDALHRLETLCLMGGVDLPLAVLRRQVASALDLVVQIGRLRDGSRRVLAITEVTGMEGDTITAQDLFVFKQTGLGPDGNVLGSLQATGVPPRLFAKLQEQGVEVDWGMLAKG